MLRKLLPHAAIIISAMYFVFFFIDRVNPAMAFINNDMTKIQLCVLCVIAICNAVFVIRYNRAWARRQQQRKQPAAQSRDRAA